MRAIWLSFGIAAMVCQPAAFAQDQPTIKVRPWEQATIALFQRAAPSVVHIAVQKQSSPSAKKGEYGSGFVWDQDGHIVTNAHVVRNASSVAVVLLSGKLTPAQVLGTAPSYDLAVLQVREASLPAALPLGDSATLQVGQSVYVIGNPFGLDQTLTTGVVSALKRRANVDDHHEIPDAIQIDAATNPGNSGGPLLDSSGHLIGVNTAILTTSGSWAGIGFAIPVNTVKRVVPQLIRTGHAALPGIGIVPAPEEAAVIQHVQGLVIAKVLPNSPAERAGLRDQRAGEIGDVIIGINGNRVRRIADFAEELGRIGVGHEVKMTVLRDGSPEQITLQVIDETLERPASR